MHIQEVNNDIYIANRDIWNATQEGSYMTVDANNDTGSDVDGDLLQETNTGVVEDSREGVEVVRMVNECFKKYDGLQGHPNTISRNGGMEEEEEGRQQDEDEMANMEVPLQEESDEENHDSMEELLKEARTPLFKDSPTNRLQAILMLLNVCNSFGVFNACVDKLLKLLKHDLLPKENTCPPSHFEAKKLVSKLGLSYNTIHACKNGHCLFWNELKDAKECPQCKESRYISGSESIPVKVLRHFPLIPRLLRMYRLQTPGRAYDVACGGKKQ
jgi:hypothetical protein